jgi:hypothetical protein
VEGFDDVLLLDFFDHLDPPKKIGKVQHYGQDYPEDVIESETALMKDIRTARENAEQLYR